MKNLIFIFSILIILFKTGNVLSDNNIFNVNNVEIGKEKSKNKQKLINEAFQKAFDELINRLLLEEDYKRVSSINLEQIKNIVDILEPNQKLVMPNTNSQYGSSKDIITEDSPQNPLSLYAKTKCEAEQYILNNKNGICLRLATVFGASPRMRTDLLVNDFVYKAMTEGVLVLFQSQFKRNYIHVRDIARTFLFCIENYDKMNGEVFNVGLSKANLNKKELAEAIKEYFPKLVILENDFSSDFDNRDYIVSNDKLESYGWRPIHSIEAGIIELEKAYKMVISDNNKKYTNL